MFFERVCVTCGHSDGPICGSCESQFHRTPSGPGVRTVFAFTDDLRPVLVALKYRRERRIAKWAAAQLEPLIPRSADAICWVPATPERLRWRGYDQAGEIANEISKLVRIRTERALGRSRTDTRQTGMTRAQRLVGPDIWARKHTAGLVVLVDDVTTTGATMNAAEQALYGAGAERVVSVALAAAPLHTQLGRSTRSG